MDEERNIDKSSLYLKNMIKFRRQTLAEIAEATNISRNAIREYTSGRVAFNKAQARVFIPISDYLEIDPHYLLGDNPKWDIVHFFDKYIEALELPKGACVRDIPIDKRMTARTRKYRAKMKRLRKEARESKAKDKEVAYEYMSPTSNEFHSVKEQPEEYVFNMEVNGVTIPQVKDKEVAYEYMSSTSNEFHPYIREQQKEYVFSMDVNGVTIPITFNRYPVKDRAAELERAKAYRDLFAQIQESLKDRD